MIANYFYIMSDRVLRLVCGLLANIMLVTYLAPAELGTWNYVLSLATIAGAISIFSGLDAVVIRDLAQANPLERTRIMGSVGYLRLLAGTVAAVGSMSFVAIYDWRLIHLIIIIVLSYFTQVFHTLDYFFQSQLVPKYSALVLNITTAIGFAIKVGLMYFGKLNLELLCWILVLESFLVGVGYTVLVGWRFPDVAPYRWSVNKPLVRRYAGDGLVLLGSGLVSVFIARVSIFQIDAAFDRASVAVFGLFSLVFESVLLVNYSLVNTFFPRIIVQYIRPAAYAKALHELVRRQAVLWISLVSSIAVMVYFGNGLFINYLNPVYQQSLRMIILGLPVSALFIINFNLLQFLIIPSGNQRHQLARALLGLTVMVSCNSVLFTIGSVTTVIGSLAMSQFAMLAFTIYIFHKKILVLWRERVGEKV